MDYNDYKEINLIDYLKIIIKNKKLILTLFFIGLIAGISYSFLIPPKYSGKTIIEFGKFKDPEEKMISIENPYTLVEKIQNGFYGSYSGVTATNLQDTGLIKIEAVSRDSQEVKNNLEKLTQAILADYNSQEDMIRTKLEKRIDELEKSIARLTSKGNETEVLESQVISLKNRIEEIRPTKVIQQSLISKQGKTNLIVNIVSGGLLGIILALVVVSARNWWAKNKGEL